MTPLIHSLLDFTLFGSLAMLVISLILAYWLGIDEKRLNNRLHALTIYTLVSSSTILIITLILKTTMTTKEKIKIMQAFEDRKPIQYKHKLSNQWNECLRWDEEPYWNWSDTDYRIKPEAKIRPYTFAEMCEAVKKHGVLVKDIGNVYTITGFDKDNVFYHYDNAESYEEFMKKNVWFADNSPCGVVEE